MKNQSKNKIMAWGVGVQINNRPTKNTKGISFTNERRTRQNGKSIFYRVIISNQRTSKDARTLSVRGTLDSLSFRNSVTKYNMKHYRAGLKQQKKGSNSLSKYVQKLATKIIV